MKSAILDTHTLVWFLQKDPRLPKKALKLILRSDVLKKIPFIVICEIHYLHARGRFPISIQDVTALLKETDDFEIASHTEEQMPHLFSDLEIHDALIVATALAYQEGDHDVVILSRDDQIKKHSPVPVVWND